MTLHEDGENQHNIATAMENAGFILKDPTDHRTMAHYSSFMFDSDIICEKLGYSTPQEYFEDLMEHNPLVEMPDASGRCILMSWLLYVSHHISFFCRSWVDYGRVTKSGWEMTKHTPDTENPVSCTKLQTEDGSVSGGSSFDQSPVLLFVPILLSCDAF